MYKITKEYVSTIVCWRAFHRLVNSIVLFVHTIFYVFNYFFIEGHLVNFIIFADINDTRKALYSYLFHICKYIILVKSLEMEFLGQ